jgi:phytoene dehydrogenase-like protein
MSDVMIVGGGLAGLTCARRLQAQGRTCLVLEAAEAVGGRVRTDPRRSAGSTTRRSGCAGFRRGPACGATARCIS